MWQQLGILWEAQLLLKQEELLHQGKISEGLFSQTQQWDWQKRGDAGDMLWTVYSARAGQAVNTARIKALVISCTRSPFCCHRPWGMSLSSCTHFTSSSAVTGVLWLAFWSHGITALQPFLCGLLPPAGLLGNSPSVTKDLQLHEQLPLVQRRAEWSWETSNRFTEKSRGVS